MKQTNILDSLFIDSDELLENKPTPSVTFDPNELSENLRILGGSQNEVEEVGEDELVVGEKVGEVLDAIGNTGFGKTVKSVIDTEIGQDIVNSDVAKDVYEGAETVGDYVSQAREGALDMMDNTADLLYVTDARENINEALEDTPILGGRLDLNIPGFEGYDKNKGFLIYSDAEETKDKRKSGTLRTLPRVQGDPNSQGESVVRNLTNVVAGVYSGSSLIKGGGTLLRGAGVAIPTGKIASFGAFTGSGTIGGVMSFKPYEPRLAGSIVEWVEDTPMDILSPFFEWLDVDEEASSAEERFKIALESILIDLGLVGVKTFAVAMKTFRRERNLIKAELNGASKEQLELINKEGVDEIKGITGKNAEVPPSKRAVKLKALEEFVESQKGNNLYIGKTNKLDKNKKRIKVDINTKPLKRVDDYLTGLDNSSQTLPTVRLEEVINKNSDLFKAYPQLAGVEIIVDFKLADSFNAGLSDDISDGIRIPPKHLKDLDNPKFKESLRHEIQHLIQNIEGWEKGTTYTDRANRGEYLRHFGEIQARDDIHKYDNFDDIIFKKSDSKGAVRKYWEDAIKTKSQLTDIWNKAQGKADPLIQEAKKYGSAEEFVEAQTYYHGSRSSELKKFTSNIPSGDEGIHLTTDKNWADKFGNKTYETYLDNVKIGDKVYNSATEIPSKAQLKKQGIDAVRYLDNGNEALYVVSPNKIKITSKAQLTDIWNKAQGKADPLIQKEFVEMMRGKKGLPLNDNEAMDRILLEGGDITTGNLPKVIERLGKGESLTQILKSDRGLFNLPFIEKVGVSNFLKALQNGIKKAKIRHLENIKDDARIKVASYKKGEPISAQRYLEEGTEGDSFNLLAEEMGVPRAQLYNDISKTAEDVLGLDSTVTAYRMLLREFSIDTFSKIARAVEREVLHDPLELLKIHQSIIGTNKLFSLFDTGVKKQIALGLKALDINLKVPAEFVDNVGRIKENLTDSQLKDLRAFATDTFRNTDFNGDFIKEMRAIANQASSDIQRFSFMRRYTVPISRRLVMAGVEAYRGLLLSNIGSMMVQVLSAVSETFLVPATRLVGAGITLDKETAIRQAIFYSELLSSLRKSFLFSADAFVNEKGVLDPLRTKVDDIGGGVHRGFNFAMNKWNDSKGYHHPYNLIPAIINTTGKVARMSLRTMGGMDEFFKQLNYRAHVKTQILHRMPKNLITKAEKKNFIAEELPKYFDELGAGNNKQALEYSRKIVFQESLRKGTSISTLNSTLHTHPALQFIFPFVRTPANVIGRLIQRTPGVNILSPKTREMWMSGDPELKAEVVGNTVLGLGLYGTALSFAFDGSVTGMGPRDIDRNRLWRSAGNKPYSIRVGDKWVSYSRLDPVMIPFALVASYYENAVEFSSAQDSAIEQAGYGVMASMRAFTDRTYIQMLSSAVRGMNSAMSTGDPSYLVGGWATSWIPGIIFQQYEMGQSLGVYSGAQGFREATTQFERALGKLAPLTGYDAIKHNWVTGEALMLPTGHMIGLSMYDESDVNKYIEELVKMGKSIPPPSDQIGNVQLDGPQYAELSRLTGTIQIGGRTLLDALTELMDTKAYNFDPNSVYNTTYDDPRINAVQKIIGMFKTKAREKLLSEDETLRTQVSEDRQNTRSVRSGEEQLFKLNN